MVWRKRSLELKAGVPKQRQGSLDRGRKSQKDACGGNGWDFTESKEDAPFWGLLASQAEPMRADMEL